MKYAIAAYIAVTSLELSLAWIDGNEFKVREKRQNSDGGKKRLVCYHTSWAGRRNESAFRPTDIDPFLCTHLLYAYAFPDLDSGITSFDPNQDIHLEGYVKFTNLKKINPDLNVILSVGGGKGSSKFSRIAEDPKLRKKFAESSKSYLQQFNFTGIDIVWKYPGFSEGSSFADKKNYVLLLQEVRNELKGNYTISIAVPPFATVIDLGFDLPEISKIVDFMTVLTYSYHSSTEAIVYHSAPLYQIPQDAAKELNVDAGITNYIKRGVDPEKLNLATNLDGLSYVLDDPNDNELGAFAEDEGAGTQEKGFMVYNQLCRKIKDENWTVVHVNKSAIGPYAYKGKQWVSYDDEDMIRTKARYAVEKNLGGLMFWSIDMDDFEMKCHSRRFPLIRAAAEELGLNTHEKSVLSNTIPAKKNINLRWTQAIPTVQALTNTSILNSTTSQNEIIFSSQNQSVTLSQITPTASSFIQQTTSPLIEPTISSTDQIVTSPQVQPTPQIQLTSIFNQPVSPPKHHTQLSTANQAFSPHQQFPKSILPNKPLKQSHHSQAPPVNHQYYHAQNVPQNQRLNTPQYFPQSPPVNQPFYQPQNLVQNVPQIQPSNPSQYHPQSSTVQALHPSQNLPQNQNINQHQPYYYPNSFQNQTTAQQYQSHPILPNTSYSLPPSSNSPVNPNSHQPYPQTNYQHPPQNSYFYPPYQYQTPPSNNQQGFRASSYSYNPNSIYSNRDVVLIYNINIMAVYNR